MIKCKCIRVYNVSYDFLCGDNVINNLKRFFRLSDEGFALDIETLIRMPRRMNDG